MQIDASCRELKIITLADRMSDEVNAVLKGLSQSVPKMIVGFQENNTEILAQVSKIKRRLGTGGESRRKNKHGFAGFRDFLLGLQSFFPYV